MPKRSDISSVLLIGSGPIVIGQACEFDYSGTQAIKALKDDGLRVILVNSNPATIMTDPSIADRTYIEPITPEFLERVIAIEKPDAILPTMGGQTALNAAIALQAAGVLEKYECQLIGADVDAIQLAEDRESFRSAMDEIGIESAKSVLVESLEEIESAAKEIGFPIILRPSRTLGGAGGGIANSLSELKQKVAYALSISPNRQVLLEESLLGWKEFELEVMRDLKDNVVIICGIENLDPMGVHTGDSITVAPIQTLTDKEYQRLRDYSIAVIRKIGVETGGSNVQFAVNPANGRVVIIEMNPRVSRSSALASKATGFPIAKIAAKLAIGYTLDEISNDITRETPACFEPSIDYVVVKIPRFNFEKFPLAEKRLGTQMKAVGEVMSIGRNFCEAMQKALCSLEKDFDGFSTLKKFSRFSRQELLLQAEVPTDERILHVGELFRREGTVDELHAATGIDPWFLDQIQQIVLSEDEIDSGVLREEGAFRKLKQLGFSDERISNLLGVAEKEVTDARVKLGVTPSYYAVDTCAGEFQAYTPYFYSTYDHTASEWKSDKPTIAILGSGPNRIGQGIEFDYCCVHAVMALQEAGFEVAMVNCNPETVSTDYDVSDRLYFEPLSLEHVKEVCRIEKPAGVIVQFGGQTPLKIASALEEEGITILGTPVASIEQVEDRKYFAALIDKLKLRQAPGGTAYSIEEATALAESLGYPLMIRPSFVLGGRAMRIVFSREELDQYILEGVDVSDRRPVLLDRFLQNAIEVDVDAVHDGENTVIAGVLEHIERAGVHSGDSSCSIPPSTLSETVQAELRRQTTLLAKELGVRGLLNVQFAVAEGSQVFVIEANPRASRTIPFVSKATGVAWAKVAAKVMAGVSLADQNVLQDGVSPKHCVKACVFPFERFPGVDTILGPEMKSTGEVMGIGNSFSEAFLKSQLGCSITLPNQGRAFISVKNEDKPEILEAARLLRLSGFDLVATSGTARFLNENAVECESILKVHEGGPNIVDALGQGEIDLVINTPEGSGPMLDSASIRLVATELRIPVYTTASAALAAAQAIRDFHAGRQSVPIALQDIPIN